MAIKFPSAEWTAAFKDAINANPGYAAAAKDWTHGKVAYVVKARPQIGIDRDTAMVLDLHAGKCREAVMMDAKQANAADFVIVADFERWKEVLTGQVDPTKAMMQNRLKLEKGHLPTIVKFVVASKEIVRSALTFETDYPA